MMQKQTGNSKSPTKEECLLFLNGNGFVYGNGKSFSYGDGNSLCSSLRFGYGNGFVNGECDGYGFGNGLGNGLGDGNGYGHGYGHGNDLGNGEGNGDGRGEGSGNGFGYGNGDGKGDGEGNGFGNGDCFGRGRGRGNGDDCFELKHPFHKVDGLWCKFLHIRGDYAKVMILDMYKSENSKIAYIAKDENVFAHGETLKDARKSLLYKLSDRDTSPFKEWKLDDVKTKKELVRAYRAITGACEFGTRQFCESVKLPARATVAKAIEITRGQYGNESFEDFFNTEA